MRLSGPEDAPALLFSNSLGTDLAMWDPQASALSQEFRVLRYDTRGHGQSAVTPGPYTIDQLADDVIELLDSLKLRQVYFCGLSMGGMIGMTLALRAAHRLRKVVLCSTAPKIGTADTWNTRIDSSSQRRHGWRWWMEFCNVGTRRTFVPSRRRRSSRRNRRFLQAPVEGYVACCAAVRDADMREAISGIRVPTLIITGAHDPVTTPADGHFMENRIAGASVPGVAGGPFVQYRSSKGALRGNCALSSRREESAWMIVSGTSRECRCAVRCLVTRTLIDL